jgi:DNA polymerase-1
MTTLLIDADVLLWRASAAVENVIDFGDGIIVNGAELPQAIDKLRSDIRGIVSNLQSNKMLMMLSDPRKNWRKELLPTYKSNRTKGKPSLYWNLRNYLLEKYDCRWYRGLEADDVLGLYQTGKGIKGEKILVSIDKDMQGLPGRLFNPGKPDLGIRTITVPQANYYHLFQTLTGDSTDGYTGCPGIGPKKAERALEGKTGIDAWKAVVEVYESKGLTERDALLQARVARILRDGEYDPELDRVIPWTPPSPTSSIPASAKSGTPVPAETPRKAKGGSTSSRRSSSAASRSTSKTARSSTATTTGKKASRSRGISTPPSDT